MEIESGRINLPSANDSFDDEDNLSDDVEDEVFIKSARNGFRHTKDKTLQKPLMAPRKNSERGNIKKLSKNGRSNGIHPMEIHTTVPKGSPVLITVLYVAIALGSIIGLAGVVVFLSRSRYLVDRLSLWFPMSKGASLGEPCTSFQEELVWEVNLPHAISQGQKVLASLDINNDSIEDIIIGYDSGLNGVTPLTSFVCQLYLNTSSTVCDGGLVAINGSNGSLMWTTWLDDAVIAVHCLADLDLDGLKDCVVVGKTRALWAISSKEGKLLWSLGADKLQLACLSDSVFRSAQFVEDVSDDGVPDLLVAIKNMGVGLRSKCPDYIATINGYTGAVLQLTATADHRPISIGPLLKSSGDGITYVIYSTASSLDANGSTSNLYMASLKDVTSGRKDLVRSILGNISRRIDEVVVADITADGMEDLIVSLDNSSSSSSSSSGSGGRKQVIALSGAGLSTLWTYNLEDGTSLKVQALANLNGDDVLDVAVRMTGAINGSSNSTWIRVLDGRSGRMVQDLPHRAAGWNVRGQRLAVGNSGTGLDVIVDWIAGPDELVSEGRRPLNRLMGFSARGELPAFVLYATPTSASAFTPVAESSLHDVLDIVASRDDLRAKFSNYIRHVELERAAVAPQALSPSVPAAAVAGDTDVIVEMEDPTEAEAYASSNNKPHSIRKHGRWPAVVKSAPPPPPPPPYDYDNTLFGPAQRRSQRPPPSSPSDWNLQQQPSVGGDGSYITGDDYSSGGGSSDYSDASSRDYDTSNRYRQRGGFRGSASSSREQRRGKRIRREQQQQQQSVAAESIGFPPMVVGGVGGEGSVDLVFGVQWSWVEPEEMPNEMKTLSDCVSRRLDQDGLLSELLPDVVADYAAECSSHSQLQQQHGSSSSSSRVFHHQGEPRKKMRKMKRDDVGVSDDLSLLSSAVDRWLVPLARRLHGRVALKRVRLRCQCSSSSGSSTTSSSTTTSRRPCSKLRPVNDLRRAGRTDYFDSS